MFGEDMLTITSKRKYYLDEVKNPSLNDWLSCEYSKKGICKKYKIRSTSQLENWINGRILGNFKN